MLHAYCVRSAHDDVPPAGLTGVDGAPVRAIIHGPVSIWVSETGDSAATLERLREHERVVRAALTTRTPLPVRFGSRLRSEREAIELLESRREAFEASLERLAGKVEFGLRIACVPGPASEDCAGHVGRLHAGATIGDNGEAGGAASPHPARADEATIPASPGAGRRYLERLRQDNAARSEAEARAGDLLDSLEHEFGGLDIDSVRIETPEGPWIAGLAHLVHTIGIHAYASRLRDIRLRRTELRIAASGPWAPYTFVDP